MRRNYLPANWSAEEVIGATYLRCDREDVIKQTGSDWVIGRTWVKDFIGNQVWMEFGYRAPRLEPASLDRAMSVPKWNLRWAWKRFWHASILHHACPVWIRFAGSSRPVPLLLERIGCCRIVKEFCAQHGIARYETSMIQSFRELLGHWHEIGGSLRRPAPASPGA